jgi:preprotein translocase subunit YajC
MENYKMYINLALIIGVFYFLIILPKNKKAKQEKSFLDNLKVGDRIVTTSGIHAKVLELLETTAVVETMSGKLKIEKQAISPELSARLAEKK